MVARSSVPTSGPAIDPEAADDGVEQHLEGNVEPRGFGAEHADVHCVEAARKPGEGGRGDESQALGARDVDAGGAREVFVRREREQRAAEERVFDAPDERDGQEQECVHEFEARNRIVERDGSDRLRRRDTDDADATVGQRLIVRKDDVDDDADCGGKDREVVSARAQRDDRDEVARHRRKRDRRKQRRPKSDAGARRNERDGVRADTEEGGVAERELACESEDDVESVDCDRRDEAEHDDLLVVRIAHEHGEDGAPEDREREREPRAAGSVQAEPFEKRPVGRSVKIATSNANATTSWYAVER